MTTKSSSSLTTPAGQLSDSRRAEIIADLNTTLAYMVDLFVSSKQAHWNVHGPNFTGLHELLDTIAAEARGYADTVAERTVALRGTAHGTINDVASVKQIPAFPTDMQDWEGLTREMHERLMKASERLRESAASMDDELGSQDIYVEIIRGLDKWAWMLEAHLSTGSGGRSR
ncbi:MAG: DNA starvation/stationary phase protection protein Dps [Tepidiformaceae bacterium]